jgi:hypothetical protein
MTAREPYVAPTEEESWPTLDADCRARSCKLPHVMERIGWVERKLTAKKFLLAWGVQRDSRRRV